jgi:murein hydrolase activator
VALVCGAMTMRPAGQGRAPLATPTQPSTGSTADRLGALRAEADALLAEQRSLLVELRHLEVTRRLRAEELRAVVEESDRLEQELSDTARQIDLLQKRLEEQAPAWRRRMVELYKLGRPGYGRVLLGVHDARQVGQAYRVVAAMTGRDREFARAHLSTRRSLEGAREALLARRQELARHRPRAAAARAAADRAVHAHVALVAAIDGRRDLNAQLAGEVQAARDRLQATFGGLASGAAPPGRPLRGALAWPLSGRIVSTYRPAGAGGGARSGIEIAAAAGTPAAAADDGVVAYAGAFTGFGNLVILDHGTGTHSVYGHLDRCDVSRGDRVSRGQAVGTVGTAPSGAEALYFELRVDGRAVDPLQWLKRQP